MPKKMYMLIEKKGEHGRSLGGVVLDMTRLTRLCASPVSVGIQRYTESHERQLQYRLIKGLTQHPRAPAPLLESRSRMPHLRPSLVLLSSAQGIRAPLRCTMTTPPPSTSIPKLDVPLRSRA